jgi:hypothetical protein
MAQDRPAFKFPGMLNRVLPALALQYRTAKSELEEVIVNSRPVVDAGVGWDSDFGDRTDYHHVRLLVPASVFSKFSHVLDGTQEKILSDMRALTHCRGEYVQSLTVELDEDTLGDWRAESGVFARANPAAVSLTAGDLNRIWTTGCLRVFISHKAECKEEATSLKLGMSYYGLSAFVAHCDIEPARDWQDEIERALQSMHVMVLLLTKDYHDSVWTDQETGVAMGRGVPIVPVHIDIDPYGFVGKLQAVQGKGRSPKLLARELLDVLLDNPVVRDDLTAALVTKFEKSSDWDEANELIKIIAKFKTLPRYLVDRLEKAPKLNASVAAGFTVQRMLPALLKRLKGRQVRPSEGSK